MNSVLDEIDAIARAAWERPIPEAPAYFRHQPAWPDYPPPIPPRPMPRADAPSGSAVRWMVLMDVAVVLVCLWLLS